MNLHADVRDVGDALYLVDGQRHGSSVHEVDGQRLECGVGWRACGLHGLHHFLDSFLSAGYIRRCGVAFSDDVDHSHDVADVHLVVLVYVGVAVGGCAGYLVYHGHDVADVHLTVFVHVSLLV